MSKERTARYRARLRGENVPKMKPGSQKGTPRKSRCPIEKLVGKDPLICLGCLLDKCLG